MVYLEHVLLANTPTFIIISYSTLGGVNAVIKTDKMQFIIILIFIALLLNNVAPKSLKLLSTEKLTFNLDQQFFNKYAWIFLSFIIPLLLPHIIQRIMMSKNSTQCRNTFILSSFLSLIFYFLCIIMGIFAFSLNQDIKAPEVLLFLLENNLTQGFLGLGFIGVLSILISTVDSFMNIAAISLTRDVLKPIFATDLSSNAELKMAMSCNVLMSLSACIFSLYFKDILEILLYALNLWGPIMSIPLYFLIFDLKVPKATFYISLLSSSTLLILIESSYSSENELFAFIPATLWSLTVFISAFLMQKLQMFQRIFFQESLAYVIAVMNKNMYNYKVYYIILHAKIIIIFFINF